MSIGGFISEAIHGGANVAPTPQVTSAPKAAPPVKTWAAPDVSGAGQVTVHRDHLTEASDVIKACLPDLDAAVSAVRQHTGSFGSLQGWEAANEIMANLVASVEGFAQFGGQTSDAHAAHAKKLSDSAATYEAAEQLGTQIANDANGNYGSAGSNAGLGLK